MTQEARAKIGYAEANHIVRNENYLRELRLFLEEICCNLCRFRHAREDQVAPQDIRITQECWLGDSHGFADIQVQVKGNFPYFVEVDYGYSLAEILASLTRKFGPGSRSGAASKIVIVIDAQAAAQWQRVAQQIQSNLQNELCLELWDEATLASMLRQCFGVQLDSFSEQKVLELRNAVDTAKGMYAFEETWADDELQHSLIWHYGFWRLQQLRATRGLTSRTIMPPGLYPGVVVVMADLCGFSGYMRDTRRDDVIRQCLTTFYAKARYEILNTGGMMYQFVGDEVIGLYGIPDQPEGYMESAFECAKALVDIGNSVSHKWQRQIDRVQSVRGLHIGIAMGDMQMVSLCPFSRTKLGGLGEVINLAARLLAVAGPGEIVASNTYYQGLMAACRSDFGESLSIDARNMGMIQTWKAKVRELNSD